MKIEEMYEILNSGIPSYVPIELDINTITRECTDDYPRFVNSKREIRTAYEDKIVDIAGSTKYGNMFFDNFRIVTNHKTSKTVLEISPLKFIVKLKEILGVTNPSNDFNDPKLYQDMVDRLDVLDKIKTEKELEQEFPMIYADFEKSVALETDIRAIEKENGRTIESESKRKMRRRYGFDFRFNIFMSKQQEMYHHLVHHRQFVEDYTERNPIDLDNFTSINKNRFNLYVAWKYLKKAYSTDDLDIQQQCVYYLTNYISTTKNYDGFLTDEDGEVVTFKKLLTNLKKLLKSNLELKPMNESREVYAGYHAKHVKNHINKYFNGLANWSLVNDNIGEIEPSEVEAIRRLLDRKCHYLSTEGKEEYINKRISILARKRAYYESKPYALRLFGKNTFDGYVAYVYSNGVVVLDKLNFNTLEGHPAYDEAIYVMDIDTFLNLEVLDKKAMREDEEIRRMYHNKTWEPRLTKEVDEGPRRKNEEHVKTLVKKYNK